MKCSTVGYATVLAVLLVVAAVPARAGTPGPKALRSIDFGDHPDTVQRKVRNDTRLVSGWTWVGRFVGVSREELEHRIRRTFGERAEPIIETFLRGEPYWYSLGDHSFLVHFTYCDGGLCRLTLKQFPTVARGSDTEVHRPARDLLVELITHRYGEPSRVRSERAARREGEDPYWTHHWTLGERGDSKRIAVGVERDLGWSRAVMRVEHPRFIDAARQRDERRRRELIERRSRDF